MKAKRKRLISVFATLFAIKQGARRVKLVETKACDYATGAVWRQVKAELKKAPKRVLFVLERHQLTELFATQKYEVQI